MAFRKEIGHVVLLDVSSSAGIAASRALAVLDEAVAGRLQARSAVAARAVDPPRTPAPTRPAAAARPPAASAIRTLIPAMAPLLLAAPSFC